MAAKKKAVTRNKLSNDAVPKHAKMYVAGIGASTGGLDALRPLISQLKSKGNVACIIAQHLYPKHPSLLTELLNRRSEIPVEFATEDGELLPDHVYVVPPNSNLLIENGRMKLIVPETGIYPNPSVDLLFQTIAENYGDHAVGVVLSGSGSDGSVGVEAIKAVGGIVIAQVPEEAEQNSMPSAAILTGVVDFQLSAKDIAAFLNSLGQSDARDAFSNVPKKVKVFSESLGFRQLIDMVFKATQMDARLYKEPTLIRQVEKRFRVLNLKSIDDYIDFVGSHSEELAILQQSFLISVTSFFRDPEPFQALERVVRGLIANKKPGDSIRVWVPGCATGEEAYTIAILLKEIVGNRVGEFDIRVFATDIDVESMVFAREGLYPPSALENVDSVWRERYFTREGGSYKIGKTIRELCVFSIHDVIRHPPFMRMDIVSCRNLLIYFKPVLQEQLFASFHYALNPDGYLLLGKSESVGPASKLFETVDGKNKIFRRKAAAVSFPARTEARSLFIPFTRIPSSQSHANTVSLVDVTRDMLMAEYAPPSILVSMSFDVLHFFGDVKRYLDFPKGSADFSLFSICTPELRGEMKTLCYRITQEGVSRVIGLPTKVVVNGQPAILRLSLRRVQLAKGSGGDYGLLISFEEHKSDREDSVPVDRDSNQISEIAANEIQRLQKELADTREHLQAVIEELEASNEELQSLNEELQSSSEELQSSNEELQSSNEELTTLNDELRAKSSELVLLNTALSNIQESIHMGLVVVDKEGKVMRFNDLAVRVFGLMQDDIGQHLYGVPCHIELPHLREHIDTVISTGVPIIERVRQGEYHYLMQIAPYVNEMEQRTGAVLTFTDISELQRAEDALRQSEETYRTLFKNMLNGFAYCRMIFKNGVPDDFIYLRVNDAFEALTGLKDVIGKNVSEVIPGIKESDQELLEIYGRVAITGQPERFEIFVDALQMWFWISVYSPKKGHFVAVFEVITERKRAEEALQVALTKYKTLFDAFPLGITVADKSGQILESNRMAEKLLGLSPEEQRQRQIDGQEWQIVRLDGSPMLAEEFASVRALKEDQVVRDVEMGIVKPSSEITWISVTAAPIHIREKGLVITYTDITDRKQTQDNLRRSEARLHLAQKAANAGTWEWDLRTNENIWSDEIWKLYGLEPHGNKPSYETWLNSIHPNDRDKAQTAVQDAARRGTELSTEWRVLDPDGKERWIMSRGQPLNDIAGRPERFVGIVMDITERKQAELALAEDSNRRRILFEQAKDGIVILDYERKVVEANKAFADMLGYTKSEIHQLHAWDWDTVYSTREQMLAVWPELPTTGDTIESQHRRKNGSVYDVEISWNPAEWGGQRQLYCVCRDITERKRAQEVIQENEEKLRQFIQHAPVSLAMFDRDMRYMYVSQRWFSEYGVSDKEIIGRSHYEVFPEIPERWKEVHQRGLAGEVIINDEDRFDRQNGSIQWLRWEIRPWHIASGEVGGIIIFTEDITERKRVLEALKESEERYRLLFENMTNGFALHEIICDEQGKAVDYRFLNVNPAFEKLTGLPVKSLLNKTVREVIPDIENEWIERYGKVALTGEPITFESYTKSIDKHYHVFSFCPLPNQFAVIFEDVTERKRALEALKENDARLRSILQAAPVGIGLVTNRIIMEVNETITFMVGYSKEELVGKSARIFYLTDEEFERVGQEKYAQIKRIGIGVIETKWQHKNGNIIDVILSSAPTDPTDLSKGVTFAAQDITERKRAEEKIKESEERFRLTFQTSPDAVIIVRQEDGVFVEVNDGFCRLTGYTREEVIGKTSLEINIWYDQKDRQELYRRLKEEGYCENLEARFCIKDGSVGFALMSAGTISLQGVPHLIATIRSIVERKQMEEELRVSEEKYRVLSENATDIIWTLDFKTERFTYFSPSIQALRGYSPEEAMAIPLDQTLTPESYRKAKAELKDAFEKELQPGYVRGVARLLEIQELCKDGSVIDTEAKVKFTRDSQGNPTGLIGITRDVTQRKRAEALLTESEERFRLTFRISPDSININRLEDGLYVDINEGFTRITGFTREDVIGKTSVEINIWNNLADRQEMVRRLKESGYCENLEAEFRLKDGTLLNGLISSRVILLHGVAHVISITRDITERKRAEDELRKLSLAIERNPNIIVITDLRGVIEYVNPAFEAVTGYTREEVIGQNPRILKSGEQSLDFYQDLWKTISGGNTWEGRFVNKKKDGQLYTEEAAILPLRNSSGQIVNYVAVKRDITEHLHLQEERERLQEQLQQAQKMESVGRLAGGVAHDFNNMLHVIIGHADMILGNVDPIGRTHDGLFEIRKAAQRSADLVRQLLTFARKQAVSPKVLDLNSTVSGMLKMLQPLIGEEITLTWIPGQDLWNVKMDPTQVDQLLTNLVVNARDAIKGVGKIRIETKNAVCDEAYCNKQPSLPLGDYALMVISDDGCGMDKDTLNHVFEPFFTTKDIGEGTGLGLATVYGIIKQNGGFINVESEPGKGATFEIYLPKWKGDLVESASVEKKAVALPGDGETLLLVEDEETILDICKTMLEQLGYVVLTANSPSEALKLAEKNAGKIRLLITDVVMPEMNGRELADKIIRIQPGLKCLFMSGYTADIIASRGVLDEGTHFLQKPFYMKELAAKIRESLEQK